MRERAKTPGLRGIGLWMENSPSPMLWTRIRSSSIPEMVGAGGQLTRSVDSSGARNAAGDEIGSGAKADAAMTQ